MQMKKSLRYLLALALVVIGLGASAAVTVRDLGYVSSSDDVYPATGFVNQSTGNVRISVAIRLPHDEISKYVGGSLTGVKIGWSTPGTQVKYWLRAEYEGQDLAFGTTSLKNGWNNLKFNSPYVIPSDVDEVLFGYDVVATPGMYYAVTSVLGKRVNDVCYIINRDIYDENPNAAIIDACAAVGENGLILTTLTLEVDPAGYQNRVKPTEIQYNPLVTDGTPATAKLTLKNEGMNAVNRVTMAYKLGDATYENDLQISGSIQQNATVSITAPLPGLGTGTMEISVTKVNGVANNLTDKVTADIVTIPEEVSLDFERRSLIEYFVDENEYRVPVYYTEYMNPVYQKYRDQVTLICRHVGDQFMIGDNEDEELLINLYGDQKSKVSVPSMTLDRSLQLSNLAPTPGCVAYGTLIPDELTGIAHVAGVMGEAFAVPTFAGLEVESDYNHATNDGFVNISVNGTIAENVLPEGENLRLNVYLLEDDVYSTSQEFKGEGDEQKGEFWHQAVIRQQPTPIYGEDVEAGDFSRSYKVEIDPEWKAKDMKVVAMLSRPETNGVYQRNVINVAEAEFDPGKTAIAEVIGTEGSTFEVVAGSVVVNGSAAGVEVYSLSGARVNNSQLPAGVYVVRSASEVAKICVK